MDEGSKRTTGATFLLQAVLAFATIGGFVLAAEVVPEWWMFLVACTLGIAAIVVQVALYRRAVRAVMYQFKGERDPRFLMFFSEWYNQHGEHYIFCKDLEWMSDRSTANIAASLCAQGPKATIFVSESGSTACNQMAAAGVRVYVVPNDVAQIRVKMSLHIDDIEMKQIIIQRKSAGQDGIRFTKTTDDNMIGLAETLIASCKHLAVPM